LALLLTNGFFIFYLLTHATVAGQKTLQRLTLQHLHRQNTCTGRKIKMIDTLAKDEQQAIFKMIDLAISTKN
jgi:hypothetical protein